MFQLNGERYGNNSIVDPNDIGEDERGLFCLTDQLDCCRGGMFGTRGRWFDEQGVELESRDSSRGTDGFYDNRGVSTVRLNRVSVGVSNFAGGIFRCEIPDAANAPQEMFIGLYTPNSGMTSPVGGGEGRG